MATILFVLLILCFLINLTANVILIIKSLQMARDAKVRWHINNTLYIVAWYVRTINNERAAVELFTEELIIRLLVLLVSLLLFLKLSVTV